MSELQFESEFVDHTLREWAALVDTRLRASLQEKNVGVTDALAQSLSFRVMNASGANKGSYQLVFNEYGRFVDMGRGRGIAGLQSESNKQKVIDRMNKNVRKPRKWYSKTFYSSLNGLISALSKNYAEYAAKQISQQQQQFK